MKLITLLLATCYLQTANATEKYLQYKYNDSVTIVISSAACPFVNLQAEYKYAVAAFRIDGNRLAGCFKKLDENFIEIHWHNGDKSVFPANVFLQPNSVTPSPEPSL